CVRRAAAGTADKAEASINPALARFRSFGMISGSGWCAAAKIVSLVPNEHGSAAGLVAIGFGIRHGAFIRRINRMLVGTGPASGAKAGPARWSGCCVVPPPPARSSLSLQPQVHALVVEIVGVLRGRIVRCLRQFGHGLDDLQGAVF